MFRQNKAVHVFIVSDLLIYNYTYIGLGVHK